MSDESPELTKRVAKLILEMRWQRFQHFLKDIKPGDNDPHPSVEDEARLLIKIVKGELAKQ